MTFKFLPGKITCRASEVYRLLPRAGPDVRRCRDAESNPVHQIARSKARRRDCSAVAGGEVPARPRSSPTMSRRRTHQTHSPVGAIRDHRHVNRFESVTIKRQQAAPASYRVSAHIHRHAIRGGGAACRINRWSLSLSFSRVSLITQTAAKITFIDEGGAARRRPDRSKSGNVRDSLEILADLPVDQSAAEIEGTIRGHRIV